MSILVQTILESLENTLSHAMRKMSVSSMIFTLQVYPDSLPFSYSVCSRVNNACNALVRRYASVYFSVIQFYTPFTITLVGLGV